MITSIGRGVREGVEEVGRVGTLFADFLRAVPDVSTWGPFATLHARRLGVESLPIGLFIAVFTGLALTGRVGANIGNARGPGAGWVASLGLLDLSTSELLRGGGSSAAFLAMTWLQGRVT